MKTLKYIAVILTLITTLLLSVSCSSKLNPTVLAATTQDTVEDVKISNDDVFKEIQRNIDLVASLRAKVEDAHKNNKEIPLKDLIKDLETITKSYEKLAGQKDDINKAILQKLTTIRDMQKRVNSEIQILNNRGTEYTKELHSLNIAPKNADPEIIRTRKKALTQACKYVKAQIDLWVQFNSIEQNITTEISNVQQKIDLFLSLIDSSAILFREGLNLLYLQRDINNALSLFTNDLPTIEQLTRDMEGSWDNLDVLIDSLTSLTTNFITK